MRAFELYEIESFAKNAGGEIMTSKSDIQKSIDYFYGDFLKEKGMAGKGKKVGNLLGYDVEHYVGSDVEFFFLVKDAQAVFYLAVSKLLDGYTVGNIRSAIKGAATKMYSFLLTKVPALYSDKVQTKGGKAIWNKLAKKSEFKMSAIDIKTGKEWGIRPGEKEVTGKMVRIYDKIGNKHNIRLKLANK